MAELRLGVNVDHVATVRNARGGAVPDPVRAALLAIEAGADGITAHLREDRRHIHDDDMRRLKAAISKPLNFEMAATEQMLDIALQHPVRTPAAWCRRSAPSAPPRAASTSSAATTISSRSSPSSAAPASGCRCSSNRRSRRSTPPPSLRAPVVELHTGAWCDARRARRSASARTTNSAGCAWRRRRRAALGLECHAGHGLDYDTARTIAALPQIVELNIGHFLDRRGDLRRARRERPARCARRWTRAGRAPSAA